MGAVDHALSPSWMEATDEDAIREEFMRRFEQVYANCVSLGRWGTALRALIVQLRLCGLDGHRRDRRAGGRDIDRETDRRRARTEQPAGEETGTDRRRRIEAELRERIETEVRAELAAERRTRAEQSGTKRDGTTVSAATLPVPAPAALVPDRRRDEIDRAVADVTGLSRATGRARRGAPVFPTASAPASLRTGTGAFSRPAGTAGG